MEKIILDASIAIKWFFSEKDSEKALQLQEKLESGFFKVFVPQIFFFEVINVLKTKPSSNPRQVRRAIEIIFSLPFKTQKVNKKLLGKANFYAQKYNLSIYDASYISLANINKAIFVTADQKLINKVKLEFIKSLKEISLNGKQKKS